MQNKPDKTGLINQDHEVHRLENLFYKRVGSAYYLPSYGLKWDEFLSPSFEVPLGSFTSHLTQQCSFHGIVVKDIQQNNQDFAARLRVILLDESQLYFGSTI